VSAHDPHLIKAAGPELRLGGLGIHFLASAGMTDGHATLIEHPLAPKSLGAPLHTHSREDEFSFVVEGTIGAMIGDRVVEAAAGDLVVKPRGIPHAFWNASEAPARIVELIVPAGFEGYFREMAPVLAAPRPDFARAAEICARYGIQMDTDSIGMLHARFALACPTG
jgi:mannose-6-phosphate isomerase-like protein (cupin superfamily)